MTVVEKYVEAIKPRANIRVVNIRVKRENSEIKILNLKTYKKSYFHCLANAELKRHMKVLKNLFHNMTLKKRI